MKLSVFLLRSQVLFWSFFVLGLLTLPFTTFLCNDTVRFFPFGGISTISYFAGYGSSMPVSCLNIPSITDLTIHLVFLSMLVAHLLSIVVLYFFPREEEVHFFASKAYVWLMLRTIVGIAVMATIAGVIATFAFQNPEIAQWMIENTNLQSPGQTILSVGVVIALITVILAAWHEERFTFWDSVFFCIETIILIYEVTFIITGIDLGLVILSLPFPAFNDNYNPVFPPMWREWYKEFK